jgi:hypothetical protein
MSVAELLPSIQSLSRAEKEQLFRILGSELATPGSSSIDFARVIKPEDRCPYTPDELARLFQEEGGVALTEIWRELGVR